MLKWVLVLYFSNYTGLHPLELYASELKIVDIQFESKRECEVFYSELIANQPKQFDIDKGVCISVKDVKEK